ncbi:MAG TPA: hypothetical protein VGL86_29675 [Polyangia bacterium]
MRERASWLWVAIVAASAACGGNGASSSGSVGTTSTGGANGSGGATPGGSGGTSGGGGGGGGGAAGGGGSDCPSQATRIASSMNMPGPLAVDATYLYWAEQQGTTAAIERAPLAGGAAQKLTSANLDASAASYGVAGLAVDADGVYWSTYADRTSLLWAYPFAAGTSMRLADTSPIRDLVVDGGIVYFSNADGLWNVHTFGNPIEFMANVPPGALAIDAWHVFVAGGGVVNRVDRTSGAVTTLADRGLTNDIAVAVDFDTAYVVDDRGGVWGIDAPGALPRSIYGDALVTTSNPWIQLVGSELYFTCAGGIQRIPTDGSSVGFVSGGVSNAVVDGDRVFFSRDDEVDVVCR